MKTSLNELRLIEAHLLGNESPQERLLVEARLILQPDFRQNLHWQQKTHGLVRQYGRQQLKKEIEQVHQALFCPATPHQTFRKKVMSFFGR
jgi:hypothetical protein